MIIRKLDVDQRSNDLRDALAECAYKLWPTQDGTVDYSDDPLYSVVENLLAIGPIELISDPLAA